jgi:enterochelin esterase-like enzyme
VQTLSYVGRASGTEEVYRIYLPPDYDSTQRRYPVLYLLHGWPYDETHWDSLGASSIADGRIQEGTLPPFIIVSPRGRQDIYVRTSGGQSSFEDLLVNDLVPHIDTTYRTWPNRESRAIGGISRGGVWALEISMLHPDLFATVGAHSPALSVNMAPTLYDPFHLLQSPSVRTLRVFLDAGDTDWTLPSVELLYEDLTQQGVLSQFTVRAGGHQNAFWAAGVTEYLSFHAVGWPFAQ